MKDYENLCGRVFNHLLVIQQADDYINSKGWHTRQWTCKCDCGNSTTVREDQLKSGHTKSCGCIVYKDITGKTFGRLHVIERTEKRTNGKGVIWLCECECGNVAYVSAAMLLSGNTKSCGCLQRDVTIQRSTKHGFAPDGNVERLYKTWQSMKQRCTNPKNTEYQNYGGRGITICEEWLNSYLKFREWAYANGYNENAPHLQCTIDRIDNNKGYSPDNCRWVDMKTQSNNKSTNHYITYNNETHTLAEWERLTGISRSVITCRIKRGWSVEKTFTTPVRKIKKANK